MKKPEHDPLTFRQSVNMTYYFLSCYSMCFLVFLRFGFGSEALGWNGVGAVGWMIVFGSYFARGDYAIWQFLQVWFIALVIQRIITGIRWWKRIVPHSHWSGDRIIQRMFPKLRSEALMDVLEGAFCVIAGVFVMDVSEALGVFLVWGAVAMLFRGRLEYLAMQKRLQNMHDAEIESRFVHGEYRGGRF